MGGFYGQVIYEFNKIFSMIKTKNNSNENTFAATSNEAIVPVNQWDTFNIESANKWIQINSTKNDNVIKIGHGAPGAADITKTVVGFWPLESVPEGKTATELVAGTIIKTTTSEYDAVGHARGSSESYFILPANNTEKDLTSITSRVENLENTYIAEEEFNNLASEYLSTNQYIQETGFETKVQDYLDSNLYINAQNLDENEIYATTKITGTLDEMYGEEEPKTLSATIGLVSGEKSFVGDLKKILNLPDDYEIEFTLSQAISQLCKTVHSQASELQRVQLAQAELLIYNNELRTKIEQLEKQIQSADN